MKIINSRLIFCCVPVLLSITGCANLLLPDFKLDPNKQYTYKEKKEGLEIAVEPFTDPKETEHYFGINFKERGYLPVLLVAKNTSSGTSYILDQEKISIEVYTPESNNDPDLSTQLTAEQDELEAGAMVTAVMLMPMISMFALNDQLNLKEVERNLVEKEFHTTTLSPGKETYGFIYFKVPKAKLTEDAPFLVRVSAHNLKTKQSDKFDIKIAGTGASHAN